MFHRHLFQAFIYFSYLVYLGVAIGFLNHEPAYFVTMSYYMEIFIGIFLLWRFRPHYIFPNHAPNWDDFDRKVAFSSGLFILTTMLIEPIYHQLFPVKQSLPAEAKIALLSL